MKGVSAWGCLPRRAGADSGFLVGAGGAPTLQEGPPTYKFARFSKQTA